MLFRSVGNTGPYSGAGSSYSPVPKSIVAWCKMVNDQGGVNGRKIQFLSYDDAYIARQKLSSRHAS